MISAIRLLVACSLIGLYLALGLAGASAFADAPPAPEFSADIVSRDAAGSVIGASARLYVANHKVRIETPDVSGGYFLIDGDTDRSLFVRPVQRVFMEAKQSSRLTRIFVPVDPNDPCPQWQSSAKDAGIPNASGDWHCERTDAATVNGRGTIEYRVIAPDQEPSLRWVDPDLGFPIKLRTSDGASVAIENIHLEAQPANLFVVPQGYGKFDPQALIDRIKQSDVWVEPPK